MEKKTRDTNIELLRIFAMFLVVVTHCILHSEILKNPNMSNFNLVVVAGLKVFALMCNGLFVLISGYYMVNSKFKLKKILSLWGITLLYSIFMYFIFSWIIGGFISTKVLNFMPVLKGNYWFITSYIALYFLAPIINIICKKLTKKQFEYLLLVSSILFGALVFVTDLLSNAFIGMVYVYLIGAYIRLHVTIKKEKGYYLTKSMIAIITLGIMGASSNLVTLKIQNPEINELFKNFHSNLEVFNNIFLVFATTNLFMKVKTKEIKNNIIGKISTFITPSIFSVYIIHENINIREMWEMIFHYGRYANSLYLIVYILLTIVGVFFVCLLIDFIRRGVYFVLKQIPIVKKFVERINICLLKIDEKVEMISKNEEETLKIASL